jgi:hypothetical protein
MTWRVPVGEGQQISGDIISIETYYEKRPNPDDPTKEQVRRRRVFTSEFRGYDLSTAEDWIENWPVISITLLWIKSFYAIGGGGYNLVSITDAVIGDWEDAPGDYA